MTSMYTSTNSLILTDNSYRDREPPLGGPLPHHRTYGSVSGDSADQGRSGTELRQSKRLQVSIQRCNDLSFDTTCCRLHVDSLLDDLQKLFPFCRAFRESRRYRHFRYFCHYVHKTEPLTNHSHLPGHSTWGPFGPSNAFGTSATGRC